MNQLMLKHYIQLTEFLGYVLGPDYEVTLHDVSDVNHSLVAIANGHISGRSIGAPLTNVALQIINSRSYESGNWRLNYRGLSVGNKVLRSSTLFIKDENGALAGLLCINFDDSRYQDLADQVLKLCHPDVFVNSNFQYDAAAIRRTPVCAEDSEAFYDSAENASGSAIRSVIERMQLAEPSHLNTQKRVQIIRELEKQGVFLLKGAVRTAADILNCSQASIYRYRSQLRTGE